MNGAGGFATDDFYDARMRMAESVHSDAAKKIEILFAGGIENASDAALDQSFDFLAGDGGENSLTIEDARDIREIDQLIGAEIFGAGRGHVVGVDVVQLIV